MAAKPLHGKEASRDRRPKKSDEKSEQKRQICTPALKTKKVLPSSKLSTKVVLHCSESNVLLTLVDNIRLFETGDILSPQ